MVDTCWIVKIVDRGSNLGSATFLLLDLRLYSLRRDYDKTYDTLAMNIFTSKS